LLGARIASVSLLAGTVVLAKPSNAADWAGTQEAQSPWVELWAASPQQPIDPVLKLPPPLTLNGQTIRQVARLNSGGSRLRLWLSNEHTDAPTVVGDVRVAVSTANGAASSGIVVETSRAVTFGGQASITLPPNAAVLSDPVEMSVGALTLLAVSIDVSQGTAPTTCHLAAQQTAYIAAEGQTAAADLDSGGTPTISRHLLTGMTPMSQVAARPWSRWETR